MKSVAGIAQVTNAMQVVAAAQHQRLRTRVQGAQAFAEHSWSVLNHLVAAAPEEIARDPLLNERTPLRAVALVLVSGDRGMAGDYDQAIVAQARRFVQSQTAPVRLFTIGSYGREAMRRLGLSAQTDLHVTTDLEPEHVAALTQELLQGYREGLFDAVHLVYTQFLGGARSSPTVRRLLPIQLARQAASQPEKSAPRQYIFEPDPQRLLAELAPMVLRFQVFQAVLDAMTAETAARMLAMRVATRNAQELMERLRVGYNKARQQAITSEMLDIIGGSAAVRQVSDEP